MMVMDEFQKEYIESSFEKGKCVLLKACAGSGKTFSVVEKIGLVADDRGSDGIVATAFGNIAARELRERIRNKLGKNDVLVGTLHSLGNFILKDYFGISKTVMSEWKTILLAREILVDVAPIYKDHKKTALTILTKDLLESYDENRINGGVRRLSVNFLSQEQIKDFIVKFELKKEELGVMDYCDMIYLAHEKLSATPEILEKVQNKFHSFFIDEAQDLDNLQYRFITLIAAKSYITFVGDLMQTIYQFRNASPENFSKAYLEQTYPKVETYFLKKNYRSVKNIVDISNIIRKNAEDDILSVAHRERVEGAVNYTLVHDNLTEDDKIAEICNRLIKEGAEPKDIAIISRYNMYIKSILEPALTRKNVQYRLMSRNSGRMLTQKPLAELYFNIIAVILNPNDIFSFFSIGANIKGIGKAFVEKCTSLSIKGGIKEISSQLSTSEREKLNKISEFISKINILVSKYSVDDYTKFCKDLFLAIKENLDNDALLSSSLEVDVVTRAFQYWVKYYIDAGESDLVKVLSHIHNDVTTFEEDENSNSVGVYTVHGTKGAEFKYVIVGGFTSLKPKSDMLNDFATILYVQMTRAIDRMYIVDSNYISVNDSYTLGAKNPEFKKMLKSIGII